MNNDFKNIDDLFRKSFDDFEPVVPPYIWNNIEEELRGKKKKRFIVWFRSVAAAVLLMLAFGSGYYFAESSSDKNAVVADNSVFESENIQKTNKHENNGNNDYNFDNTNGSRGENNLDVAENIDAKTANFEKKKKIDFNDFSQNNISERRLSDGVSKLDKQGLKNEKSGLSAHDNQQRKEQNTENLLAQSKKSDYGKLKNNRTQVIESATENEVISQTELSSETELAFDNEAEPFATNFSTDANDGRVEGQGKIAIDIENNPNGELFQFDLEAKIIDSSHYSYSSKASYVLSENMEKNSDLDKNNNLDEQLKKIAQLNQEAVNENEIIISGSHQRKFLIGGEISPMLALNSSQKQESSPMYMQSMNSNTVKSVTKSNETTQNNAMLSYTGGLNFVYEHNERLSVKSGLYYAQKAQFIENIPIEKTLKSTNVKYTVDVANVSVNFEHSNTPALESMLYQAYDARMEATYDFVESTNVTRSYYQLGFDLKQSFQYLEIPIIVKYKLIDSKIDFSVHGGFSTGFLVGNKVNLISDSDNLWSGKTSDVRRMQYSASMGLGLEYQLFKRIFLNVEPTFKYALTPISENKDVYNYPYSFTFFTGINYRF